jgi:hypothetical protein
VLQLFLRHPWLRRLSAAILGLLLGVALVAAWGSWNARGLRVLAADLRLAYETHDAAAMERLFCWDGVDAATRARIRLVILQEYELPVASVVVRPLSLLDRQPGPGLRPNLPPAATIEVAYDTSDRLSAAYLAGRDGFRHRLIVMLPAN